MRKEKRTLSELLRLHDLLSGETMIEKILSTRYMKKNVEKRS
jgi:hypothetical protein